MKKKNRKTARKLFTVGQLKSASHRFKKKFEKEFGKDKAPVITAIVKGRERTLTSEEITILRTSIAKDVPEPEFRLFMLICKKKKLDPFTKQVYAIMWPRRDRPAEMVIIVGIGGYRSMAARSHKRDFGGTSSATYTWPATKQLTLAKRTIPESATVEAFRRSGVRGSATCYWEEFAPADLADKRSDFWNRMPKHMLAKCAEALALRKVFPDLSDIYSEEEMGQKLQDLTPEGRLTHVGGVAASGSIVDDRAYAKEQQRQLVENKLAHAHDAGSQRARQAEATLQRVEEEDRRFQEAKRVPSSGSREARPENKSKPLGAGKSARDIPAGSTLLTGTVHQVSHGTTSDKHVPFVKVRLNQVWYTIWSKTIAAFFPTEMAMVTKVVQFWQKGGVIVGLKRINDTYFEADGRTPIPREPGAEGD